LLAGLLPPYPDELRAEFVEADEPARRQMLRSGAKRRYRWSLLLSGVAIAMIVKWTWECGLLVYLGATAGFAHAADLKAAQQQQAAENTQIVKRLERYEAGVIEDRISRLDSEDFNLQMAIAGARRTGRQPDPLHLQRREAIKSERGRLVDQLQEISPKAAAAVRSQ
jgi:hypothetical protein